MCYLSWQRIATGLLIAVYKGWNIGKALLDWSAYTMGKSRKAILVFHSFCFKSLCYVLLRYQKLARNNIAIVKFEKECSSSIAVLPCPLDIKISPMHKHITHKHTIKSYSVYSQNHPTRKYMSTTFIYHNIVHTLFPIKPMNI